VACASAIENTLSLAAAKTSSGRIQPIYLDQLGPIAALPLGLGLLVLTILEGEEAITQAKQMMERARQIEARMP
jgi:predicted transposase YdaD